MFAPESQRVEQSLKQRLASSLQNAGWNVEESESQKAMTPGFLISKGPYRYALEFRASPVARRQTMQALLADAILRARARARAREREGVRPLAIVGAPTLTPAMRTSLREYAQLVAPEDARGWIDESGEAELHGPGLSEVRGVRARGPAPSHKYAARAVHDLFTDLNQWLLKVLLARNLPARLLAAPREPVRNARELATAGGVSVPSAARFAAAMESEHHLVREEELRLVRTASLLDAWKTAVRRSAVELPLRWIMRPADPQQRVAELARAPLEHLERRVSVEEHDGFIERSVQWERGPKMCLALFTACDAHGLGIVRGIPRHLYMEPFDLELLRRFGLAPAEGADRIDVIIRKPRFPHCVFRGAVMADDAPVADVIQTWLDVAEHPARGSEQAEYLWDRVLASALQGDQPR